MSNESEQLANAIRQLLFQYYLCQNELTEFRDLMLAKGHVTPLELDDIDAAARVKASNQIHALPSDPGAFIAVLQPNAGFPRPLPH
jgi:hypothetical protein